MRTVPLLSLGALLALPLAATVHQGNGFKIGEVTEESAIVWTRLTVGPEANWEGAPFAEPTIAGRGPPADASGRELREFAARAPWRSQLPAGHTVAAMNGALPGTPGSVRIVLRPEAGGDEVGTTWLAVDPRRDHTRQVAVSGLMAGTRYRVRVESRDERGEPGATLEGAFRTAPGRDDDRPVVFGVVTCGDYPRRDDFSLGHRIYASMQRMDLDFMVHAGDVEYYDRPDPWATSVELARFKWNRLFALPYLRDFHRLTAVYYTYDDHDLLRDDCWPGQTFGSLTWEEGLMVWDEQVPVSTLPYRTIRYSRDLQVWVLEGRRFRSPNTQPDGPDKTILGPEQRAWLRRTIAESDATFKVVVSPTPIVGPDRPAKNDNHANAGFRHEGEALRRFLAAQENLIVVCGDRHWQYFSVDPETGLREFGCGPSSDFHAGGYAPEADDRGMQKYFRLKGGFLTVDVRRDEGRSQMNLRHHAVDGTVVHEAMLTEGGGFTYRVAHEAAGGDVAR
jgi:alkaline phosphatase D